jgi:hypothetical protein
MKHNRKIDCIDKGVITHSVFYINSKVIEIKFYKNHPTIKYFKYEPFNLGTEETERKKYGTKK